MSHNSPFLWKLPVVPKLFFCQTLWILPVFDILCMSLLNHISTYQCELLGVQAYAMGANGEKLFLQTIYLLCPNHQGTWVHHWIFERFTLNQTWEGLWTPLLDSPSSGFTAVLSSQWQPQCFTQPSGFLGKFLVFPNKQRSFYVESLTKPSLSFIFH